VIPFNIDARGRYAIIKLQCGHTVRAFHRTFKPSKVPKPPILHLANFDRFGAKIENSGNADLKGYHETIRYRLNIAEYCLKLLLDHYDNSLEFAVGLTGFLVQAKAALDSLCQEINVYYSLMPNFSRYVLDTTDLTKNLPKLSKKNKRLARYLWHELDISRNKWFRKFKEFRDEEGTHRCRIPRNMYIGPPSKQKLKMAGVNVAPFRVRSIERINSIIERTHRLMT
jgi:hypothetical protein